MNQKHGFFYGIIAKKKIVLVLTAFVLVFGVISYISLPKQEYPVTLMPIAVVSAAYPGAGAEDMEELVTKKIEDVAMSIDGFDNCTSNSTDGLSVTQVFFDMTIPADKLERCKNELRNKLEIIKLTELPSGLAALQVHTDVSDTAGLVLAFSGEGRSNAELAQRAKELKDRLTGLEGVKKVEVSGEAKEKIEVLVDTDRLNRMDISLGEVSSMIQYQSSLIPTGSLKFETDRIPVNTSGKFESLDEIGSLIVGISPDSGAVTMLRDIAEIKQAVYDDEKYFQFNGKDTVLLNLYYKEGINVVSAGKTVLSEAAAFRSRLPDGISVDTVANLSEQVDKSVNGFTQSVLEAVIIVLIVIMLGMSFRNGGIVAVAIPIALMIPFLIMMLLGIDVQFISLSALIISLGMLVDTAIVVTDAIQVRIDDGEERLEACVNGVKSVVFPVLATVLTISSIFVMFYTLPGSISTFTSSLPTIVITALIASFFVSIFITPIMCYLLIKKKKVKRSGKFSLMGSVKQGLDKVLNFAIKHKAPTIITAVALLGGSVSLLATLNIEFMPKSEKAIIDIHISTTNNTDLRQTKEAVGRVVEIVSGQPETAYYLSAVGGSAPKFDFSAMPHGDAANQGNVVIGIDMSASNFDSKGKFAEYLQERIRQSVPGCEILVKELGITPDITEPIQLKIMGGSFDELNSAALIVEDELSGMEGVTNVYSDKQFETYSYYVDMKDSTLNALGMTKAEVQGEINAALMGREAAIFRKDMKEYPVVVSASVNSMDELKNLMVKSGATGSKHQIKQLADIGLSASYANITRYNGERCVTISASPKLSYSSISIQTELMNILETKDLGNVAIKYEGDIGLMGDAMEALLVGVVIGIMGIVLVLFILFYSLRKMAIALCAIPFCFVGASLGLFIFRPGFNLFSIFGMLSLLGVVVANAILLVDFIDKERAKGVPVEDACKVAASRRFRPILLSVMAAVLAMLPLALGGNVLFKGMAIAFMCGDTISMLFTLVVVPVVYAAWEGSAEKRKMKKVGLGKTM